MKLKNNSFSPDRIEKLSRCEIFVFGSNLDGQHFGGAARTAYEKFGAVWGVGEGPTGRCYAIPTMHGGLEDIRPYIDKFIEYAKQHPNNRFLLTRIGCGIAGFKDIDMAQMFVKALDVPNIAIPRKWLSSILIDVTLGLRIPRGKEDAPAVINNEVLKNLCKCHLYEIGAGISKFLPAVRVRYVAEDKMFGYAMFGQFFFFGDDFYVWQKDDKWAEYHNQDVVEAVFDDECESRGYACRVLFAGVQTGFVDTNEDRIFTGDVVEVEEQDGQRQQYLAVGAMADEKGNGAYCFILDNHFWSLADCRRNRNSLYRVGTIFYKLDSNSFINVNDSVMQFNGWMDSKEEKQEKVLMARYTPNFAQEDWKYKALDILGVEFDWK